MTLSLRPAAPDDLDEIWALVRQVVAQMNRDGNPQWGPDYPTPALFEDDIAQKALWAATGPNGRILGVAAILLIEGSEYPEVRWLHDGPAAVMHRVAVHPDARRQGVGSALFGKFEAQGRAWGVPSLRVDTYCLNRPMQALITRQGFVPVGQTQLPRRPLPTPCYEKLLGSMKEESLQ